MSIVEEHVAVLVVYHERVGQCRVRIAGIVVTLVELEIARAGGISGVVVVLEIAVAHGIVGDIAIAE